MFSVQKAVA